MYQTRSGHHTVFSYNPHEFPAGLIRSGSMLYATTFFGDRFYLYPVPRTENETVAFWSQQVNGISLPKIWQNPTWTLILGTPVKKFDQQFGLYAVRNDRLNKLMPLRAIDPLINVSFSQDCGFAVCLIGTKVIRISEQVEAWGTVRVPPTMVSITNVGDVIFNEQLDMGGYLFCNRRRIGFYTGTALFLGFGRELGVLVTLNLNGKDFHLYRLSVSDQDVKHQTQFQELRHDYLTARIFWCAIGQSEGQDELYYAAIGSVNHFISRGWFKARLYSSANGIAPNSISLDGADLFYGVDRETFNFSHINICHNKKGLFSIHNEKPVYLLAGGFHEGQRQPCLLTQTDGLLSKVYCNGVHAMSAVAVPNMVYLPGQGLFATCAFVEKAQKIKYTIEFFPE